MSYSSFYVIDKNYNGENVADFKNSWLFSPVIWNVLSDKFLPRKWGMIQSAIGLDGANVWEQINNIMNSSDNTIDRICWELSNQQIFFTKNKTVIANAIRDFLKINDMYDISDEDGISVLKREHIIERFNEIANQIESTDENLYPYFVLKNTYVDDGVERWFYKYNKETDEDEPRALNELTEYVGEFVVIEDDKILEFISNLEFDYLKG